MLTVGSRIETVKVHHLGATIFRRIELQASPAPDESNDSADPAADRSRGATSPCPLEVEIPDLPLSLHDATVKARVISVDADADSTGTLVATDLRVGLHTRPPETCAEPPDEAALRQVQRRISQSAALLARTEGEIERLAGIPVPERADAESGQPPMASPIAARVALELFTDRLIAKRLEEASTLRDELRAARDEEAALKDAVTRASSARRANADALSKIVCLRLRHEGASIQRAVLELSYFVPGARWAPHYQIRLDRDCGRAEIQMRALVCQRTGEDWPGARLVLSTAAPLRFTELPELSAIRVGKAQTPQPARVGFRAPPQGSESLYVDYDRDRDRLHEMRTAPAPFAPPNLANLEAPGLNEEPEAPAEPGVKPSPRAGGAPARGKKRSTSDAAATDVLGGGETFGQAEMSPAPTAPPPSPSRRPIRKRSSTKPGGAASAKSRSSRGELDATLEALVYNQLRLGPPTKRRGRGQLQALDIRKAYLSTLSRAGLEIDFEVLQVVHAATRSAAAVADQPLPPGAVDVRQVSGRFDFSYRADATVDVPSDGRFHSVALGARQAESNVRYVVVPRRDPGVFRVARLVNPIDAPMLPGQAEIYVGGEYILSTQLATVVARGELELGLGVEQGIKCARNTQFRERRSGGNVVAMTELHHTIEITLANNLARAIECEARERIPQPAEGAEVVVEESRIDPPWTAYDQGEHGSVIHGGRQWQVTVEAGEHKRLVAEYIVKIYAQNEIVGGNRREA